MTDIWTWCKSPLLWTLLTLAEPAFLAVAAGDTVLFLPTDKGDNVETIKGMLPEGAESFKARRASSPLQEKHVSDVWWFLRS